MSWTDLIKKTHTHTHISLEVPENYLSESYLVWYYFELLQIGSNSAWCQPRTKLYSTTLITDSSRVDQILVFEFPKINLDNIKI